MNIAKEQHRKTDIIFFVFGFLLLFDEEQETERDSEERSNMVLMKNRRQTVRKIETEKQTGKNTKNKMSHWSAYPSNHGHVCFKGENQCTHWNYFISLKINL